MADAKINIEALADNKELKGLNDALSEGTKKLKDMQKELKAMEKAGNADEKAMASLRAEIQMQKTVNQQYAKAVKNTANELTNAAKAATSSKNAFSDFASMISSKLGVDITNLNMSLTAMAGTLAAVATTLISSGREVSGFVNQFKAFAGSVEGATAMYNKFNDVYRNTNYDEQAVYDMAKAMMRIGLNAEESADLITKCADASASLGQGQEYAAQLADSLAKVKVGGELSQKQLVELAKSGIDLNDVQDEIRQGGEAAYNALIKKLEQFQGGMADSKQTAAEMEGDIKGNLVEIGRQAALLVDDFFDFSGMLRTFYQWVIDVSQTVIDKLKSMRTALKENLAAADAYSAAMQDVEEPGLGASQEEINAYGEKVRLAHEAAEQAKEDVRAHEEALATLKETVPVVKAIAKASGAVSSGGGSSTSTAKTTSIKEDDPAKKLAEEIRNAQTLHNLKMDMYAKQAEANIISQEKKKELQDAELEQYKVFLQAKLDSETLTEEQIYQLKAQYAAATAQLAVKPIEAQKQEMTGVQKYYDQMAKSFASAMTNCIMNAESFSDAFKNIIKQIIAQLMQAAIYAAIVSAFSGGTTSFGGAFNSFMGFGKKADGGYISGPGSGTSDSAGLYALSDGEYVLNARATEMIGLDTLNRINGAGRMASGGAVAGGAIGGNVTLNVSAMDASGFGDFLSRGGLDSIKQALFDDDRMFAANAGVF